MKYDIVVIGGGPAGLSAAIAAYDAGCRSILILDLYLMTVFLH